MSELVGIYIYIYAFSEQVHATSPDEDWVPKAKILCSACRIGDNRILYIGGRTNPMTAFGTKAYVLRIQSHCLAEWEEPIIFDQVTPRWRHSAVVVQGNKVCVFGGLKTDGGALNDVAILDLGRMS